jgi:hypothetical protein
VPSWHQHNSRRIPEGNKRMMLITTFFFSSVSFPLLFCSSNFSSACNDSTLKSLLPPSSCFPLFPCHSGTEVIIYVSKNPSTFFFFLKPTRQPVSRPTDRPTDVFSLKLFIRRRQFSWVLFIPGDKEEEEETENRKQRKGAVF